MEPLGTVLPIYIVVDESGSMAPYLHELNSGLNALLSALQLESFAASKVRFSMIGFSDNATQYLPPTDLRTLPALPNLRSTGTTSYLAAFDTLGHCISMDVPALKSQGYAVNRPVAFFLTDGAPNPGEDWRAARDYLAAQAFRPNILAFGIGQADPSIIAEVATSPQYAFMADQGVDPGSAISEWVTTLTQSVISSGQALATGNAELQMERPLGFSLAVDQL